MSIIGDVIKFLGAADLDKALEVIREIKSLLTMLEAMLNRLGID